VNNVYGTRAIVSEACAEAAGEGFLFRPLDRVQVKGREDPVEILELVGAATGGAPEWLHAFASGLRAYREAKWDEAAAAFGACRQLRGADGPSEAFLARIQEMRQAGARGHWDGVWKLQAK
jgi:adenylate cyclase